MRSERTFPHTIMCLCIPSEYELFKVLSQCQTAFGNVKNLSSCKNVVGNRRFVYCSRKRLVLPDTADATDNTYKHFENARDILFLDEYKNKEVFISNRLVTSVDVDLLFAKEMLTVVRTNGLSQNN
jgi:hypothetical protein